MNRRITVFLILVLISTALATGALIPTAAQERPVRIIFMHHSTGEGLIEQGGVREAFTQLGYAFWDHGYNDDGLVDAEGNWLGINWDVPDDNTDPDGWHNIFNQPVTSPPTNTFSHMLEYDVIIFKSCFPSSDIQSEEQFQDYRSYFLDMRDVMDQHPDKIFIPFTTPPLVPNSTSPEDAARARRWSEYLTSDEYLAGHPNIFVFNFFDLLADQNGYLRAEYRGSEDDSHPNELANQTIGPIFVSFVDQAIHNFVPGQPSIQPELVEPTEAAEVVEPVEPVGGPMPPIRNSTLIDDLEAGNFEERWWSYINNDVTSFECTPDHPGHDSGQALRLLYDIRIGGSAGCGSDVEAGDMWAEADGISFYWRADQPNLVLRVELGVADPTQTNPDVQEATPFEIELRTEGNQWTQKVITWDELVKPDWAGDTGVNVFDPAQVVWVSFDVGHWEIPQKGAIWIDDIQLVATGK